MVKYPKLDRVVSTMSAEEFFRQYVSKRIPVIIQGLPDDEGFKAQKWVCPLVVSVSVFIM